MSKKKLTTFYMICFIFIALTVAVLFCDKTKAVAEETLDQRIERMTRTEDFSVNYQVYDNASNLHNESSYYYQRICSCL